MDPQIFQGPPGDYRLKLSGDDLPVEIVAALSKSELQWIVNAGNRELEGDW